MDFARIRCRSRPRYCPSSAARRGGVRSRHSPTSEGTGQGRRISIPSVVEGRDVGAGTAFWHRSLAANGAFPCHHQSHRVHQNCPRLQSKPGSYMCQAETEDPVRDLPRTVVRRVRLRIALDISWERDLRIPNSFPYGKRLGWKVARHTHTHVKCLRTHPQVYSFCVAIKSAHFT